MTRFTDMMGVATAALLDTLGAPIEYWPAGVEDDAIDIDAIWTLLSAREEGTDRGMERIDRAEAQIWADDDRGIATPDLRNDVISTGGARWVVVEILETVGGMHRLLAEKSARAVTGRGRGMR